MKHALRTILLLTLAVTTQTLAIGQENIESLKKHLPDVIVSLKEFTMPIEAADEMGFDWLAPTDTQPKFEGDVAILDKQSLMRSLTGGKNRRGIAGVFTDPQFQFVAKIASNNPNVTLKELPSAHLKWGECALIRSGDNVYGIAATAVDETINLELIIPSAGVSKLAANQAPEPISVQDRFNVVCSEKVDEGKIRWVVVRAAISPKAEQNAAEQPATADESK